MNRRGSPFPVLRILVWAGTVASAVLVCLLASDPSGNWAAGIGRTRILLAGAVIAFLASLLSLASVLLRGTLPNFPPGLAESARRFAGTAIGRGRKRRKTLEKAAEFADSNPNLILTVTKDGRIVYANRSVERMLLQLGLPGQHYELLLPDNTEEIVQEALLGTEKDRRVARKIMGRTIDYTVTRLEEGEAAGFYGTDVTGEGAAMEKEPMPLRRAGREGF